MLSIFTSIWAAKVRMLLQHVGERFRTISLGVLLAVLAIGGLATPLRAAPFVRVVAVSQPPSIVDIDALGLTLNSAGLTTFRSSVNRLWSEAGGNLQVVAQQGLNATGTAVQFGQTFTPAIINNVGDVAFYATLQGSGVNTLNNQGIWLGHSGALSLVVRTGTHAVGLGADSNFFSIARPNPSLPPSIVTNSQGKVAFQATAVGTGIDPNHNDGIWAGSPGSLHLVAMEDHAAPNTSSNFIGIAAPVMNNLGDVAFKSTLGPGLDSDTNVGVFGEFGGTLGLVARAGDAAPGGGAGVHFQNNFSDPVINDAGNIAFSTDTTRKTFNGVPDQGVWASRNGSLAKVAMTGDSAPGTAQQFYFPFGAPVINAQGRTAFTANLSGPNQIGGPNYSIWSEGRSGSLELIARQGQQAPGLPGGFVFSGDFQDPAINSSGRIAFMGRVLPDATGNTWGIWAQDQNFNLQLVALAGNPVDGSGVAGNINYGEFTFVGGSGGQDGRRTGFNDHGQVAFRAGLDSGIQAGFVSNLAAFGIPSSGDYNGDGVVDAADYTVWRDTLGSTTNLAADGNGNGVIDAGDYDIWTSNFGKTVGSGSGASANGAVPEPASLLLLLSGTLAICSHRCQKGRKLMLP